MKEKTLDEAKGLKFTGHTFCTLSQQMALMFEGGFFVSFRIDAFEEERLDSRYSLRDILERFKTIESAEKLLTHCKTIVD